MLCALTVFINIVTVVAMIAVAASGKSSGFKNGSCEKMSIFLAIM